jgi:GTP cyclohydrolase II
MRRLIETMKSQMAQELSKCCYDEGVMQDEYEYMYDTEDSGVFVLLRNEGDGIYKAADVVADSRADKKHPNIEAALKDVTLDLSDVEKEIEETIDSQRRLTSDPYAYYGVSRSDFV